MFFNNNKYIPVWRLWVIHLASKVAGVGVHVHGMPYGSNSKKYRLQGESSLSRAP